MARGLEKHRARQDAIAAHGKDLARRARRVCELCQGEGDLRPYDTDPDAEPSLETLALACQRCRDLAEGGSADERELRFLETAVWHEQPQVAAMARAILQRVDAAWARATLDMLPE